jgi:hypothetical protein
MGEIVLLYIVVCKVDQDPSPRPCKARECAEITVSMHPPCGPLSRESEILCIAEILGIFPEAYSEVLRLVCWAYHFAPAEVPKNSVPLGEHVPKGGLEGGSPAREESALSIHIFVKVN